MKSIAVIGGSSGIGKALVHQLADSGYNVMATYNETKPGATQNHVQYVHFNALETTSLDFLPDSLDGLVYCPGSIDLKPFARIKTEDFANDFQLQVGGAIRVIQNALPKLKSAETSSIVMFSTVAVQTGFPFHSKISASKGAIEGLTRALAAEFAPKIRVNAVAPSITDTPLASSLLNSNEKKELNAQRHPLKKIGSPESVASVAAFLLSDRAQWITGQVIHVDGGISTLKN